MHWGFGRKKASRKTHYETDAINLSDVARIVTHGPSFLGWYPEIINLGAKRAIKMSAKPTGESYALIFLTTTHI